MQLSTGATTNADAKINSLSAQDNLPTHPGNQILVQPGVPKSSLPAPSCTTTGPSGRWRHRLQSAERHTGAATSSPTTTSENFTLNVSSNVADSDAWTVHLDSTPKKPPYSCDITIDQDHQRHDAARERPELRQQQQVGDPVTLVRDTDDDGIADNYQGIRDNCQDVRQPQPDGHRR